MQLLVSFVFNLKVFSDSKNIFSLFRGEDMRGDENDHKARFSKEKHINDDPIACLGLRM